VDVAADVPWTAVSESDFLTVTDGASGIGPGIVTYTVARNEGGPRRGTLRVADQTVTVFQASRFTFTDHPIQPGSTPVKAIHFLELRARIDALREGLPPFQWTDAMLTPGLTPVRLVHLTELRAALAEAYRARNLPAPPFVDVTGTTAVAIRAAHLMELRAAVEELESTATMPTK